MYAIMLILCCYYDAITVSWGVTPTWLSLHC